MKLLRNRRNNSNNELKVIKESKYHKNRNCYKKRNIYQNWVFLIIRNIISKKYIQMMKMKSLISSLWSMLNSNLKKGLVLIIKKLLLKKKKNDKFL